MSSFVTPESELQALMDKINQGITPMMTDIEQIEVKKYIHMKDQELFEFSDDEEILTQEEIEYREKMLKKSIEEAKHRARKEDVIEIKLTQQQKDELRKQMSSVLVRPDPNSSYNKSDDSLNKSKEEKLVSEKLKRIRNCYYDVNEWIAIMNTIREAIELELKSDKFIWMGSYAQRVQAFNEGKIKLNIQIPKLYLNRVTPVTDPNVMMGILEGRIQVVEKSNEPKIKRKPKSGKVVSIEVESMSESEVNYYIDMHKRGYRTPISEAIKSRSTIYDRYIAPKEKETQFGLVDKNGVPIVYDWINNGPDEYFRRLHNIKITNENILENVQKANEGKINKALLEGMNRFNKMYKNGGVMVEDKKNDDPLQQNPNVVKLEQDLLRAIQLNTD